ncbi:MAG: hypothetical protein QW040_03315 [Candidatus Aenigmatarchaeota archaeon]
MAKYILWKKSIVPYDCIIVGASLAGITACNSRCWWPSQFVYRC